MLARIWYCWKHFSIGLDDELLSGMVVEEEIFDSDFLLVFVSFCHFLFLTWCVVLTGGLLLGPNF